MKIISNLFDFYCRLLVMCLFYIYCREHKISSRLIQIRRPMIMFTLILCNDVYKNEHVYAEMEDKVKIPNMFIITYVFQVPLLGFDFL